MNDFAENIERAWNNYGPNLLYAIIIMVAAYLAALLIRFLFTKGVDSIPFIADANKKAGDGKTIGASLAAAGFWIVIFIGLVLALERLGMTSVAQSIRRAVDEVFAYLPQIVGAILTFFIFFIVARVAKQATVATLSAAQADSAPERLGLAKGPVSVSTMTGTIVFAFIIVPGAIAALQVLNIDAITTPTVAMLDEVASAIPNILVASIVIGLFVLVAQFVSNLLSNLLPNTGLDSAIAKTGLLDGADDGFSPSNFIAKLAGVIILLLGLIQGTYSLGFDPLNNALDVILSMGAQILFGAVIIVTGVVISGFVEKAIAATGDDTGDTAAKAVRWVIVALSVILGVSRMGLDPTGAFITNASLIILVGASIAGGIAFGLGGKEWAARQLDKWNK